jgi:hypothetical protein
VWSAQSTEGKVVTLWSNLFADKDRRVYDIFDRSTTGGWVERPENKRRIEHLKYAQTKRGGVFDSIIVTQSDRSYTPIVRVEIGPKMRLVRLNAHRSVSSGEGYQLGVPKTREGNKCPTDVAAIPLL